MPAFDVPYAWKPILQAALSTHQAHSLAQFIAREAARGVNIYPAPENRFAALEHTGPDNVRVVILGQDPYHGIGQAHGLAFSVLQGCVLPPSLRNIYKELARDIGLPAPACGNLEHWARQGVLLLNTVLTVQEGRPASHQAKGWEAVTDAIIAHIGARAAPVVFMLWGAHAHKKRFLINGAGHLILEAPHPSPLSAHRGFIGCSHFSAANIFLGSDKIIW
jgi:uracil-DNA glycosylase